MRLNIYLKSICILLSLVFFISCSRSDTPLQQYEHAVEGAFAAEISQNGDYSIISLIHHALSLWDNSSEENDVFIVCISANGRYVLYGQVNGKLVHIDLKKQIVSIYLPMAFIPRKHTRRKEL